MKLTLRQQKILAAIVKEYSESADPVGSKELVQRYHFKESPATIRNEMMALEKDGYITQPHRSAGRVPTDKGYRFFITQLMRRFELSEKERLSLRQELLKLQSAHDQLGRSISNLIAQTSGQAAFALLPGQTSITGLSQIVDEPELEDAESLKSLAELFDNLDKYAPKLLKQPEGQLQTFIGGESPLPVPKNLSLVVSSVKLKGNKKGMIGILGPKRMAYAKNLSLLEYLSKLISGTAVFVLLIRF
jgi:transcriptional regulator of heat shock response